MVSARSGTIQTLILLGILTNREPNLGELGSQIGARTPPTRALWNMTKHCGILKEASLVRDGIYERTAFPHWRPASADSLAMGEGREKGRWGERPINVQRSQIGARIPPTQALWTMKEHCGLKEASLVKDEKDQRTAFPNRRPDSADRSIVVYEATLWTKGSKSSKG